MQHEITTAGPLLDGSGNLREPGYAKRLLPIYRRADIKAPASRIKEWDYYLIANDHFAVALTIDDNGYMGLDSISFLHFDQRWERTKSPMRAFPMGRTGLPESSASGTTAQPSGSSGDSQRRFRCHPVASAVILITVLGIL